MTLQPLDVIRMPPSYWKQQAKESRRQEKNRKKIEKYRKKREAKEAKKKLKEQKKLEKQQKKLGQQTSLSSENENTLLLGQQPAGTQTTQLVTAGFGGQDANDSSMLLSSILIVGAALVLCVSSLWAYRRKTDK